MVTQKITLNAYLNNDIIIKAVQGEVNSRFLEISLEDNVGAINLKNKSVQIYMKKPDGNIIFNDVTIVDEDLGKIMVCLTEEMSAASGIINEIEIRVVSDSENVLKFKGLTLIILTALSDDLIKSNSEFTVFKNLINEIKEHADLKNNPHNVTAEQIGALPNTAKFPTKTSDLINDSGFLTEFEFTETDPTVPEWAKAATKPKYTASEVGAVPSTRKINDIPLTSNIYLDYIDVGAVPTTRTINSKPLSTNITLTPADIGFGLQDGEITWHSNVAETGLSFLKKFGNIVTLYINCKLSDTIRYADREICTLPYGFCPTSNMLLGGFTSTSLYKIIAPTYFHMNASGKLYVRDDTCPQNQENPNGYNCAFLQITYITNQ